jgi:ferric-dicitrate binding protein FerR (iron transport regulator)
MSRIDPTHDPLLDLLAALCDGTLDAAGCAELQRRVIGDPAAAALYVEYMHLHAAVPQQLDLHIPAPTLPSPHASSLDTPAAANRRAQLRGAAFRKPAAYALAAAVLLFACGVAIYRLAPRPGPEAVESPGPAFVSVVDSTGDLFVGDDFGYAGGHFGAAMYDLASGSAEFLLSNSVAVRLGGKTRLTLHSPMHATLARGSATFDCPPEAKGFTVDLPDQTRIVDLGTTFRVQVDEAGNSSVRVTKGTVNCVGSNPPWSESLAMGDALWLRHRTRGIEARVADLSDGLSTGRLDVGQARVDLYLDAHFTGVSPALSGLPAIIPPRGAGSGRPGDGYQFTLKQPARLFLLVHDRGDPALDGWERIEESVSWAVLDKSFTDTVYSRLAQPGVVNIPSHTGTDKQGLHGVPHVCLIAPLPLPGGVPVSVSSVQTTELSKGSAKGAIE